MPSRPVAPGAGQRRWYHAGRPSARRAVQAFAFGVPRRPILPDIHLDSIPVRRVMTFGLVGVLATGIHVMVASALIAGVGWPAGFANGAAFCVATLASYSLNSRLTFRQAMSRRTLWRFVAVAALGALLSMAISGGAEWYGLHYLVGIALVVTSLPLLTFLAHSRWTYR